MSFVATTPPPERLRVRLAWSVALLAATVGFQTYNLKLHQAHFSAPLCRVQNDSGALLSLVTSIKESGWPWKVERLGAPGTAERFDYPLPEHAHYLTLRFLLLFTDNPFLAFNLWALLSYPVTALCTFAVFRALGVSRPVGFALALIYTFLPYHAGRVFNHTMLAYYHTVPLILLPTIWILLGRLPFFGPVREDGRRRIAFANGTTLWTVVLCLVVAVTSPYYAFFGCFFLLVAGLYRGLSELSWKPIAAGAATAAVVSAAGFACALPFVLEQREHGTNPAVAQRHANEADFYALKLTQMVLPSGDYRIGTIGHVASLYNAESLNSNENRDAVLGFIGVAGFVVLLGRLLVARGGPTLLGGLAVLNVAAVVLGASGGLGGLFNFLVFAQIRCYNRVCVFIAFWCLLAVGVLVDRWAAKGHGRRAWLAGIGLAAFGLFDVTTEHQAPRHSQLQKHHLAWAGFVEKMEDALPEGAIVFQLPATTYPEVGTTNRLPDYAHMACHSYSKKLRWSYGTNRNRRWDAWQQYVARLTPAQLVRALCLAGFDGLYVDRRGYADNGEAILAELRRMLGTELVVSESGEQMLFSLVPAQQELRSSIDEATWKREAARLLNRPCVLCQAGFHRWAVATPPEPWRAQYQATMRLINPGDQFCRVTLSMNWEVARGRELDVHVLGESLKVDQRVAPPPERGRFAIDIDLPPGEHVLLFDATPKPMGLPRMFTAWTATDVRVEVRD